MPPTKSQTLLKRTGEPATSYFLNVGRMKKPLITKNNHKEAISKSIHCFSTHYRCLAITNDDYLHQEENILPVKQHTVMLDTHNTPLCITTHRAYLKIPSVRAHRVVKGKLRNHNIGTAWIDIMSPPKSQRRLNTTRPHLHLHCFD